MIHLAIAGLLAALPKSNSFQKTTPAPAIKFELITAPKKPTTPDKPTNTSKPVVQNKTQQIVKKPETQQIKKPLAETILPNNQVTLKLKESEKSLEKRKKAAASLLFLKPTNNADSGNTISFLQSLACHDLENFDPDCHEIRKTLADVNLTYGRAVMREGAAIGAEYRLMDASELAKAFGKASRYEGPRNTLKDSSMDTKVGGSDEMRERLPGWPPDPVTGD
ncbi:MAG: hypothetical protein L3J04_06950 [Robiginitomaculum sp.]|nr:hypothetical protein [Robiginitomaculum sp.]